MGRLRSVVTRHRRRLPVLIMLLLAVIALAPLVGVDPAALGLLLDADFLMLAGAVGLGLLRADGRLLARRLAASLPVLWVRAGVALTREAPRTLAP
jgi:UPF0716 family protein affecting phage T7 exclusion